MKLDHAGVRKSGQSCANLVFKVDVQWCNRGAEEGEVTDELRERESHDNALTRFTFILGKSVD